MSRPEPYVIACPACGAAREAAGAACPACDYDPDPAPQHDEDPPGAWAWPDPERPARTSDLVGFSVMLLLAVVGFAGLIADERTLTEINGWISTVTGGAP